MVVTRGILMCQSINQLVRSMEGGRAITVISVWDEMRCYKYLPFSEERSGLVQVMSYQELSPNETLCNL